MPVGGRRLRSRHRTPWHELPRAVYESHAMSARPEMKAALGRAPRPNPTIRVHLLGTFGYYDLTHRTKYGGVRPDAVEHEASPGFSLGIGLSGSGPLMPGFQLRWHEVLRPEPNRLDVVSLEAALHFN